jgi:IS1 family transposase
MTGAAKNTVVKLLADLGKVCAEYHDTHVRNLCSKRVQCDEIWSFVGMKQANVTTIEQAEEGMGDVWTWTALDADSKLIISYLVGHRGALWACSLMADVASRLATRVQITTDGHRAYAEAVEGVFGMDIDYAMLVKIYGNDSFDRKYSAGECIGTQATVLSGCPDPKHISTSFVERQNLTMRMSMCRFTRLTNAFSKKIENHEAAIALHFMHYNFCRIHQTLRVTPAMEVGIATTPWTVSDLVALLPEPEAKKRGSYKPRNSE